MNKEWTNSYVARKYLTKHEDGLVDWSEEGMQLLSSLPEIVGNGGDLGVRGILGDLLMSRGFKLVEFVFKYELSDNDRTITVHMDDEALRVCRDRVVYNFPMYYESGSYELCDLWKMIRKAWEADSD